MPRFELPPGISVEKVKYPQGWAWEFRHLELGLLGRITLQSVDEGTQKVSVELAGDPNDPMTAKRKQIFEPQVEEFLSFLHQVFPSVPKQGKALPPPLPPAIGNQVLESQIIPCEKCNVPVAAFVIADDAMTPGQFEDYARNMYAQTNQLKVPTWIMGPPKDDDPDSPANFMKIWPERGPIECLSPEQYNVMVDKLLADHQCSSKKSGVTADQIHIASKIHVEVRQLQQTGANDMKIFGELSDLMPEFQKLMQSASRSTLDELCSRYDGFYRYVKILENLAGGIKSGKVKVPR